MNKEKQYQQVTNDFKQASGLLRHDLVWSADLESIRLDLAEYLDVKAGLSLANHPSLIKIAQKLIATDNDLTI
jgi:hypothetical protein